MAGFVQKFKSMWFPPEDDYDDEYEYNGAEEINSVGDEYSSSQRPAPVSEPKASNKVLNVHATAQLQVVLFKPESFGEETRAVADELMKMHTVVLNLEGIGKEVSRRILDFISGVAYANKGQIKRVATSTFIITPYNVGLSGDELMDELESSGLYF